MKVDLGDTTADALRFLLLGTGSLLVLRLAYAGIELLVAPPVTLALPAAIATFRSGYLIGDPMTLVVGAGGVGVRLAMAVVLTAGCTIVGAAFIGGFGKLLGFSAVRGAVSAARVVLFVSGAWWLYAALLLPPRSVKFTATELVRTVRPAVLGELSLPWPGKEARVPLSSIDRIEHRSMDSGYAPDGWKEVAEAVSGEQRMELAVLIPQNSAAERTAQRERVAGLTVLLNGMLRK